jgi:hypothetical protein
VVPPSQSAAGDSIDRQALEQALQETFLAAGSGGEIDPEEMEALCEVAARHGSEEITLDITAALIQAILTTHFRSLSAGISFWETVSREIARTLWEDPQTEARLTALWQRLREEAS